MEGPGQRVCDKHPDLSPACAVFLWAHGSDRFNKQPVGKPAEMKLGRWHEQAIDKTSLLTSTEQKELAH
jgi:hypothetical protein